MITSVHARDFMGRSFDMEIGQRTILFGPNGSGKTAVTSTIQLALIGYVPGVDIKANQRIHELYATGKKMVVGVKIDGVRFGRAFNKTPSGTVTAAYYMRDSKVSKVDFDTELGRAGAPSIFDLSQWTKLSDHKKAEQLFNLYPPGADLDGLSSDIDAARRKVNDLDGKRRAAEQTIQTLSAKLAQMEKPPGTLEDILAEIEQGENDLAELKADLSAEKRAQAEKAESERLALESAKVDVESREKPAQSNSGPQAKKPGPQRDAVPKNETPATVRANMVPLVVVEDFVSSVKSTMEAAGCTGCAAAMTITLGLAKIRKGAKH